MFMDVDSEKILTYCRATLVHLDHQLWSNVEPTSTATGCFRLLALATVALVIQAAARLRVLDRRSTLC